jgi:hypothetical protein
MADTRPTGLPKTVAHKKGIPNRATESSGTIFPFPQSAPELKSINAIETAVVLRETEFLILPDGRMIDLIKDHDHGNLKFLIWADGKTHVARHVDHEGLRFVVPLLDPSVVSALRVPTIAKSCPSIGELFLQIRSHVATYLDITCEAAFLVVAFALTTWFADRLPIAPYLTVCGPPESGKTTLERLLHCLCRRAIHASDITRASLYRLAAQVRPTFLIDEAEFGRDRCSRDLQRLLRGGNRRGARILANGQAFENFGPKVISSRLPLTDFALTSRAVHLSLTPCDRVLPDLDWEAEEQLAAEMQPMLETFRLLHYQAVSFPQYPGFLKFPPRLRDCARVLAAPMLGDKDLLGQLASALDSQVHTARFDRFSEPEYVVMLALFDLCHKESYDLYVVDVSDETNRIVRQNGETRPYSAKMVGQILNRSLGFSTRRRGQGYRIPLTSEVRRRIHSQAKSMRLKRSDVVSATNAVSGFVDQPCVLCTEFGLMTDHEERVLRPFGEFVLEKRQFIQCTNCGAALRSDDMICPRCDLPTQTAASGTPT